MGKIIMTGGSIGKFSPLSYNPILWFDADDEFSITKDGANSVSQWNDKSGLDQHATPPTSTQEPTFTPEPVSGRNSVYFPKTGNKERMAGTFDSSFSNDTFTMFSVARMTVGGPIISSNQDVTFNYFEYSYFTTANNRFFSGDASSRDLPDMEWAATSSVLVSTAISRDSTTTNGLKAYTNGAFVKQQTATKVSSSPGFFLAERLSGGTVTSTRIYINTILVFDYVLTPSQILRLHNWSGV